MLQGCQLSSMSTVLRHQLQHKACLDSLFGFLSFRLPRCIKFGFSKLVESGQIAVPPDVDVLVARPAANCSETLTNFGLHKANVSVLRVEQWHGVLASNACACPELSYSELAS